MHKLCYLAPVIAVAASVGTKTLPIIDMTSAVPMSWHRPCPSGYPIKPWASASGNGGCEPADGAGGTVGVTPC
jgi:hypothetical protein